MKKTTSILKVFAVAVLLLISTTLFSQQQVIQNLTVVDSLVISSLQNSSLVATNATTPPYRYLVIDPYGNVKAKSIRVIGDTLIQGDPDGILDSCYFGNPRWKSQTPSVLHTCPYDTRVGIGTPSPVNKLDVIGSGYFSGNLGIGTLNPQVRLDIQNNATTEARVFALGAYASRIWTANGIYAYGFGIGADGKGHIYENMNIPTPLVTFTDGKVIIGNQSIVSGAHTNFKLAVDGKIVAKSFYVLLDGWADDVFGKDYQLMSLKELERYIKTHEHLPGVPSEKEVLENGVSLDEMIVILLRKQEESIQYILELKKENEEQQKQIQELINKK